MNTGTTCETLFDIRLALSCALGCLAIKMVIAHNHPSNRLAPSLNDIKITEKLKSAAETMDIKLEDHLIVTKYGYYSFRDCQLIK
ncbi:JAB domain-containing protein [Mucilaginibacter sp.]|uniref:JAB domain-containing protein n=1 Tax=Mucilaginibacter sp. TaxID=1882438 RepID=UPI0038B29414